MYNVVSQMRQSEEWVVVFLLSSSNIACGPWIDIATLFQSELKFGTHMKAKIPTMCSAEL